MGITHAKVSSAAAPADTSKVGGPDWNDDHVIIDTLELSYGTPPTAPVAGKVILYADYLPGGNAVPVMVSNTSPSGIASASSEYSVYPAWHAFNNFASGSGWLTNGTVTGYLRYQFSVGKIISSYEMKKWGNGAEATRALKSWTLEGSNDATIWDVLDTQTNYVWPGALDYYAFAIASPASYSYYQVNISANWGDSSYSGIDGLRLMLSSTTVGLFAMSDDGAIWHQLS